MSRAVTLLCSTLLLGLSACAVDSDNEAPTTSTQASPASTEARPASTQASPTSPEERPTTPVAGAGTSASAYGLAVLAAPAEATHVTVTDFDMVRARLGVPDLTSQDIMTDRLEFWRAAEASTVLLTDGLLRAENSRYDLTYDFTQDDVDAEARWTGPDGAGWLLALRPDLDLDLVQAAIDDDAPELGGATLDRASATVRHGVATGEVWASEPALVAVGDVAAESLVVRRGCVPFTTALGVDATVEDQDAVLAVHDVEGLLEVEAVAIAFTGRTATVRLAYPVGTAPEAIEADLAARVALAEDWPTTETIGFADGFGSGRAIGVPDPGGVADPDGGDGGDGSVGEVAYAVTRPIAAATLALADLVPLGVCREVELLEEPTGL